MFKKIHISRALKYLFIFLFIIFILAIIEKNLFYHDKEGVKFVTQKSTENSNIEKENLIEKKSQLSILFAGDIMLDRYVRKQIEKYSQNESEDFVKNYLTNLSTENKKYDYVVANLEGPITPNKSKTLNSDGTYGKDLLFTFPTNTGEILNLLNIKAVSLANNHTDNFYRAGYESTKSFLEESQIKYFGNPYNENDTNSNTKLSETVCEKNICVAYIGYNEFTKNNSESGVVKEIERLNIEKQNNKLDFIIVYPHFGYEYEKINNKNQNFLAFKWIEAGADSVIGSHPHVIQNSEDYNNKKIFYSIGNYIFDQWFSEDVKKGLVLNLIFKKDMDQNGNISRSLEFGDSKNVLFSKEKIEYIK